MHTVEGHYHQKRNVYANVVQYAARHAQHTKLQWRSHYRRLLGGVMRKVVEFAWKLQGKTVFSGRISRNRQRHLSSELSNSDVWWAW